MIVRIKRFQSYKFVFWKRFDLSLFGRTCVLSHFVVVLHIYRLSSYPSEGWNWNTFGRFACFKCMKIIYASHVNILYQGCCSYFIAVYFDIKIRYMDLFERWDIELCACMCQCQTLLGDAIELVSYRLSNIYATWYRL